MHDNKPHRGRSWVDKFRDAFRGLKAGIRGQSSFFVHFFAAAAVVTTAAILEMTRDEWCLLVLCITVVLAAEMFNSALEALSHTVTDQPDPNVGRALNIGSAAVLIAAIGAAVVGAIIFGNWLQDLPGWW
jgi:diacylglycerol kinase